MKIRSLVFYKFKWSSAIWLFVVLQVTSKVSQIKRSLADQKFKTPSFKGGSYLDNITVVIIIIQFTVARHLSCSSAYTLQACCLFNTACVRCQVFGWYKKPAVQFITAWCHSLPGRLLVSLINLFFFFGNSLLD